MSGCRRFCGYVGRVSTLCYFSASNCYCGNIQKLAKARLSYNQDTFMTLEFVTKIASSIGD